MITVIKRYNMNKSKVIIRNDYFCYNYTALQPTLLQSLCVENHLELTVKGI